MASAAGFHGNLPESLLLVLQNSGGNYNLPTVEGGGGGGFTSLGSPDATVSSSQLQPSLQQLSVIYGEPSLFSDYASQSDLLLGLNGIGLTGSQEPSSPGFVAVSSLDFQELNPAFHSTAPSSVPSFPVDASELAFPQQDDPLVAEVVPATFGLITNTNLGTTISNILNNIVDAINDLITAIQDALNLDNANNLLALLLLLGLILLPFLLKSLSEGGGYGGRGYHRRVYQVEDSRTLAPSNSLRLSQQVLADIEKLEQLFSSHPQV